jgi:Aerotolerance regulator N-terminal
MNWGSLSSLQVAGLSAAAVALAVWLYLRQPRASRLRVSTLRFWESAPSGSASARRRKLREPWALLAQIFFLLLLIAALGNPRFGVLTEGRNVAIVIDAGAWSQMRTPNGSTWLDEIRSQAGALLQQLPGDDHVVLIRADLDGAPLLPYTSDRGATRAAIANLQASSAVADIPRALAQGRAALGSGATAPKGAPRGLLIYVGPGLMDQQQSGALEEFRASLAAEAQAAETPAPAGSRAGSALAASNLPPEFLVRLIGNPTPLENIGITQIALKRSPEAADEWAAMTQVRNYNDAPARVKLSLSVGGHVFREDEISIGPNSVQTTSDEFTSRSGGLLQAEITPGDGLIADNRATIVLPSSQPVSVAVISSRAAFDTKMRAVLAVNPYVKTDFLHAGAAAPATADVVIYDGAAPDVASSAGTISFVPAPAGAAGHRVRLSNWNAGHPVTRWIQSRDVTVRAAESLKAAPGEVVLASTSDTAQEPLIVARENKSSRGVIVDFDPLDSNFTEEPAFPLLMAASIEWMTHPVAEQGEFLTAGSIDLPLALSRVVAPSGRDVLFAGDEASAHFFAAESGLYRVIASGQSLDVPVNVPVLPTIRMAPTVAESAPLEPQPIAIAQHELWRWLVILALIALWLEWRFFYFRRETAPEMQTTPRSSRGDLRIDIREMGHEEDAPRPAVKL